MSVRSAVDPAEQMRSRVRDAYVREYDQALAMNDHDLVSRLVGALQELGVRV